MASMSVKSASFYIGLAPRRKGAARGRDARTGPSNDAHIPTLDRAEMGIDVGEHMTSAKAGRERQLSATQ